MASRGGQTCVWFVDLTHLGWSGPYRLLRGDKAAAQNSLTKHADIFAADWAASNRAGAGE